VAPLTKLRVDVVDNVSAAVYVSEKDEAHKHGPSFHLLNFLKSALPSVHRLQFFDAVGWAAGRASGL